METGIESRSGPFLVNLFSFRQKFLNPASLPPRAADVATNLLGTAGLAFRATIHSHYCVFVQHSSDGQRVGKTERYLLCL